MCISMLKIQRTCRAPQQQCQNVALINQICRRTELNLMYSVKTEKRRGDLQARHYGRSLVLHVVVFKPNGAQWDQTIFDAA